MKKKIVAMLLVGAMALSITACGGDKEPKKENNAKTEATEKELKENDAVKNDSSMSQSEWIESGGASNMEDGYEKVDSINVETDEGVLKYTGYELSTGDSGQNSVILYFDFTNKTNSEAYLGQLFDVRCFQNGISCSPLMTTSENESIQNASKGILNGTTINVGLMFEISDTSPVKVRVENMTHGDRVAAFFQQQDLTIQ